MNDEVKPYSSEGSKKTQVAGMFDNIASRYDLLNRLLSFGIDTRWRKKVIKYLSSFKPAHILDVATGTGDLAIACLKTGAKQITGVDISENMLARGRQKISDKKLIDRISLQYGDSENLPFEGGHFDAVTVAFGVRNFENLDKGLAEMYRVLKPGSPIAILEFSKPRNEFFKRLYYLYFCIVLPFVGGLISGDKRAYTYLPESVDAFPYGESFVARMRKAGFKNIICKELSFGISSLYTAIK
jgi:demethylmenaquinone methyltransferase / 2-methoxy-6-polyprenyl-1,4-benzoquinol methylase